MPPELSALGIFHTAVSVLAVVFGVVSLVRDGKIDPTNRVGKGYLATMFVGCVTAFGIFHHGGFGPGHVLSIVTLIFLGAGILAGRSSWLGRAAPYVQTLSFSTSFLLLMVFATTETLTRLPPDHPLASSQDDPALAPVRLGLLIAFAVGIGIQVAKLRAANRLSD